MASGVASCNTGVYGKTLDTIKQAGIRVSRRSPDSVTLQESSGTTDHNGLHRNHEHSSWQVLLRKTKSDNFRKSFDLAQCSVEDVDEAATQRLRAEEDSYKVYIEEELSLRKRRTEMHQARPWRHWTAGEWCWYLEIWQTPGFQNERWCVSWFSPSVTSRIAKRSLKAFE